jgi:hypothetical protein
VQLASEYEVANDEYLESNSKFRSEEATAKSAAESATYAKSNYDRYSAAKSAGQAEYDRTIEPLNAEKAELEKSIPVLEMIDQIVQQLFDTPAAKAKGAQQLALTSLSQKNKLSKLKGLLNEVVLPHGMKQALKSVDGMRVMLEEGNALDKDVLKKLPGQVSVFLMCS